VALQQEKNRLSLRDFERPMLQYDVMENTAWRSAVQEEAGRVQAGVPLRSELLHGRVSAVPVR